MKTLKYIVLTALLGILSTESLISQSIEYSIKASFIEKFARFTNWGAGIDNSEYFTIAVIGKSPFNGELERMAKKANIKNKNVVVKYINNISDVNSCNLLFISYSEKNRLKEILNITQKSGILTIADTPDFCAKGVHINFYVDESETIKYEINPSALKKSDLTVQMQILSYGTIISNKD